MTYLTQLILAGAIAGYLVHLARKTRLSKQYALPTLLIAAAMTSLTYAIFLLFLNASLAPAWSFYAMPLESVAVALFTLLLLQFAYQFPNLPPQWRREARVALYLTALYMIVEAAFAWLRYQALAEGEVLYRPASMDYFMLAGFVWVEVVFLRQSVRLSSDGGSETALQKLRRPRNPAARATRALALVGLLMVMVSLVELLHSIDLLDSTVHNLVRAFGILITLGSFALIYLNFLPETTSFMVKLVGVSLTVVLGILGAVGWIIAPSYIAAYHDDNVIGGGQTLRFTPNQQGAYDVEAAAFRFDTNFGRAIKDKEAVQLPFPFPYFSQTWQEAYVLEKGVLSFGQPFDHHDARYRYGASPAIAPFYTDLSAPASADVATRAGMFVHASTEKMTVTWSHLTEVSDASKTYTFQVVLFPDGSFEMSYADFPAKQTFHSDDLVDPSRFTGLVSGVKGPRIRRIRFKTDPPLRGYDYDVLVEDYYLAFREYLHRLFLPLAYVIGLSSLFIVVFHPIFLRFNLLSPLERLLQGIREINGGNLEVSMPIQFHDEIGFITESFNDMASELNKRTIALQKRAEGLESLAKIFSAIRQATTEEEIVALLMAEIAGAEGIRRGAIYLIEEGRLRRVGHPPKDAMTGDGISVEAMPCWQTLLRGRIIRSDRSDAQACSGCALCTMHQRSSETQVLLPLQDANQTLGLLHLAFLGSGPEIDELLPTWVAIAEMVGNALQRVRTVNMLEQLVQARTQELRTLVEVAAATTRFTALQPMLEEMLDKTLNAVNGELAIIHLHSEPTMIISQVQSQDKSPLFYDFVSDVTIPDILEQKVLARQGPTIMNAHDLRAAWPSAPGSPRRTWIGFPIQVGGQTCGVFHLFAGSERVFSVEDIVLLTSIVNHIGMAVESVSLRRQVREAAVQEERNRLGRDLHDSVTQSLHSLVLLADTARYLVRTGRVERLPDSLERLSESARQALKEMRLLLFQLRKASQFEINLVDDLRERLEAVERRTGVRARLTVEGSIDWPPEWQTELRGIAIEALNNALQHAQATEVSILVQGERDWAMLEICDNGQGFDPKKSRPGGIGLQSMAERARRLGAEFLIDAAPGRGVCVRVLLNRNAEKGAPNA